MAAVLGQILEGWTNLHLLMVLNLAGYWRGQGGGGGVEDVRPCSGEGANQAIRRYTNQSYFFMQTDVLNLSRIPHAKGGHRACQGDRVRVEPTFLAMECAETLLEERPLSVTVSCLMPLAAARALWLSDISRSCRSRSSTSCSTSKVMPKVHRMAHLFECF